MALTDSILRKNEITATAWATELVFDLVKEYEKQKLKASGLWGETLRQETYRKGNIFIDFYAQRYTGVMVDGRSPNTNQDPEVLRRFVGWAGSTFLAKWVEDKGLKGRVSPYAVAWKIAREGVTVPNRFNPGTLFTNVLTQQRIDVLLNEIGVEKVESLVAEYKNILEN